MLDEVQIIGYGTQKKITVTGAVSSVGTKDILKSPVPNVAQALTGKFLDYQLFNIPVTWS